MARALRAFLLLFIGKVYTCISPECNSVKVRYKREQIKTTQTLQDWPVALKTPLMTPLLQPLRLQTRSEWGGAGLGWAAPPARSVQPISSEVTRARAPRRRVIGPFAESDLCTDFQGRCEGDSGRTRALTHHLHLSLSTSLLDLDPSALLPPISGPPTRRKSTGLSCLKTPLQTCWPSLLLSLDGTQF